MMNYPCVNHLLFFKLPYSVRYGILKFIERLDLSEIVSGSIYVFMPLSSLSWALPIIDFFAKTLENKMMFDELFRISEKKL